MTGGDANAGGEAGHLGGAIAGFVLMKLPFLLNWTDVSKLKSQMVERTQANKAAQEQADLEEEDRILAKVKEHGIHSLTKKEQKFLEALTEKRRNG